jgi:hypothetical protein
MKRSRSGFIVRSPGRLRGLAREQSLVERLLDRVEDLRLRDYITHMRLAQGKQEGSVVAALAAIDRFERSTGYRSFKAFHIEQARAFREKILDQPGARGLERLSAATVTATLRSLIAFLTWLVERPGSRSRISFSDAEYFNPTAAHARIAGARREARVPTIEQFNAVSPAGEKLTWRYWNVEAGRKLHNYWTTKCTGCARKSKCTPAKERRVKRWEHEAVLDAMQERLDRAPKTMRIRRQTAEHPFGTIKAWMGATHFRLRTLEKVRTEMSVHVLAYNLKRMIAILGVQPLIQAMRLA